MAELRSLAEFCNFGASLNEMLRDRIVCGINSGKRDYWLKELTVKAIDLAQGMEMATKNAKELAANGGDVLLEIHRITPNVPGRGDQLRNRSSTEIYWKLFLLWKNWS